MKLNLEKNNDIDWKVSGMLDDLKDEEYDVVNQFLLSIKTEDELYQKSRVFLVPCIRRILNSIFIKDYQTPAFKNKDNEYINNILNLISINDISKELDICLNILPIMEQYFSYLDYEAETIVLFCNNYTQKLIEQMKIK